MNTVFFSLRLNDTRCSFFLLEAVAFLEDVVLSSYLFYPIKTGTSRLSKKEHGKIIGTAPLTGERAQGDFARPSSRSSGPIGIRQGPCRGTASRAFGQAGCCRRSPSGTASSLRLDPRCRSDLVAYQFRETPEMIGQTTGHCWRLWEEPLTFSCCSLAELVMETAKVVGTPNQVHPRLQSLEPLSSMATLAR
jgi:hypothetical protein